jgi:hypothetical protein
MNMREKWYSLLLEIYNPILHGFMNKTIYTTFSKKYSPLLQKNAYNQNKIFTELFCRTLLGISVLFQNEEFIKKYHYEELFQKTLLFIKSGFINPLFDYKNMGDQVIVEMANLSIAFFRTPYLWSKIDDSTQNAILDALLFAHRHIFTHNNNWILFKCIIGLFLYKHKKISDISFIIVSLQNFEKNYVGDGWYKDGHVFHMDYYNSFVILPFLVDIYNELQNIIPIYKNHYESTILKIQRHSEFLERLISENGTFPLFGRSIVYRTAIFHALVYTSYLGQLPKSLSYGQVREGLNCVIQKMFIDLSNHIFDKNKYLTLGFTGDQPEIVDIYSNSGSVYFALLIFIPLGLDENHLFWSSEAKDWSQKKIWNCQSILKDKSL